MIEVERLIILASLFAVVILIKYAGPLLLRFIDNFSNKIKKVFSDFEEKINNLNFYKKNLQKRKENINFEISQIDSDARNQIDMIKKNEKKEIEHNDKNLHEKLSSLKTNLAKNKAKKIANIVANDIYEKLKTISEDDGLKEYEMKNEKINRKKDEKNQDFELITRSIDEIDWTTL